MIFLRNCIVVVLYDVKGRKIYSDYKIARSCENVELKFNYLNKITYICSDIICLEDEKLVCHIDFNAPRAALRGVWSLCGSASGGV